MINSMTGYAAGKGQGAGFSWAWEMRSVNARGFDLRLRVPDWVDGLEPAIRKVVGQVAGRGNVTISLRLAREEQAGEDRLDNDALSRALDKLRLVEIAANNTDIALRPTSAAEILSMRGVVTTNAADAGTEALAKALIADLPGLTTAFLEMRRTEGQALHEVLTAQLDQIAVLVDQATAQAEIRRDEMATRLRDSLARVLNNADGADPDRVAQELALIAVKSDITEEIDRLRTHVGAARDLLASDEPVGRKLDFLAQEFNREANTLCAKAQSTDLTQTGLALKAVIDQMREQVQNVE